MEVVIIRSPYRARVDERHFLNLPGFHGGAYVRAYVEDTTERPIGRQRYGGGPENPHPRILLEIADCADRINLEFELDSAMRRMNSFHKIETLIGALVAFRDGLADEAARYRARAREMARAAEAAAGASEVEDDAADDEPDEPAAAAAEAGDSPRATPAVHRARRIRTAHARLIAARPR